LRVAIVDDISADRERLAVDVSCWAQKRGVPLEKPVLLESGEALLENFAPARYDAVFLDIYMDGINGMETARRIRALDAACRLIFITTSDGFAVESYEVKASWYLVKPYSQAMLEQALDRCSMAQLEQERFLELPGRYGPERLLLHRIAWTEYENRRIHVHFKGGQDTWISMRQGEFSQLLLQYPYFCDCMKGLVVNFEAVEKLLPDSFLLKDGQNIPISRLKYRETREQFFSYSYEKARGELRSV